MLRLGGLLLLTAVLAVVSVLFTPVRFGAVPVPLGVVLAAVANVALVRAAAENSSSTRVAAAPLGVWLLVVLGLAAGGPGGDQLVPADWRALLLLVAGMLPAALVLGGLAGRNAVRRAQSSR